MKVISLGMGQKIFDEKSAVGQRQIEYGNIVDELHLIVFSPAGKTEERKLSANVFVYSTNTKIRILYFFDFLRIVKKIIKKTGRKNLVISAQDPFEIGIVGVLLKLLYGLPLQVQVHGDFNNKYFILHSPLNFIRFFLAHIVLPYANNVRAVSHRVKESIKDLNDNIEILPIWVDRSKEIVVGRKENQDEINILTVARLEKEKDLPTAIKAFAQISNKYPEAIFTIAGDGSQKKYLENLSKELGVEEKIKFIGWVNDLPALYAGADIYISTSLFEGYGMAVVEAAYARLPLILTDAGIAREIPAFVSPPKDVYSLASSLEKFLDSRELREEMGNKAKEVMVKKSISREEYLANYKKVLEHSLISRNTSFVKALFQGNKVLRFLVGGGTAAFTQIFLLYVFTDWFRVWYLLSSIFSFCIAFVVSFLLQKLWVFRNKEIRGSHVQFVKYIIVGLFGIALNTSIMYTFVTILELWYILAQIVSGVIVAVFNFLVYRKFIFHKK